MPWKPQQSAPKDEFIVTYHRETRTRNMARYDKTLGIFVDTEGDQVAFTDWTSSLSEPDPEPEQAVPLVALTELVRAGVRILEIIDAPAYELREQIRGESVTDNDLAKFRRAVAAGQRSLP